ncbi:MAG: tripartite tricarboxylate transporter TctB family protein [Gammaproteobacteria bacterium]|nr:tripartite tricarboxylate transporter TctB family protein [Gammaproteobacteria bacterium]MDH3505746.1 tripartite tricarboxylate transporter TctB family protein [Gammaproteobacteria bacterium]
MNTDRLTGFGALLLGIVLYSLAGDSEAYLFPRFIAVAIGLLGAVIAAATFSRVLLPTASTSGAGRAWLKSLPVLAVFIAYRWAMETFGFYSSAFAAFLIIVWLYAPEPLSYRTASKRIAISAVFTVAIFALFSLLLRVQTPRGMLL